MSGLTTELEARFAAAISPLANLTQGPLCLAVSGGSDSIALAQLSAAWAEQTGRTLIGLTVDHGLQAGSHGVAEATVDKLMAIGLQAYILDWQHLDPIVSGVQAKARAARHRLLAQAASHLGAQLVLFGHTGDDQAETVLFRIARGTGALGVAGMEPVAVSPEWPQAPGVLIGRPLLAMTRAELRDYLSNQAHPWHDDPANQNSTFTRVRLRKTLATVNQPASQRTLLEVASAGQTLRTELRTWLIDWLAENSDLDGDRLTLSPPWRDLPPALQVHVLGVCIAAVSGAASAPRLEKLLRVLERLETGAVTLAGALLIPASKGLDVKPAPLRKRPCGQAGPALRLPLAVRIAHLAGDIHAVLRMQNHKNGNDSNICSANGIDHNLVRHQQGMASTQ
jgi:tRNA(Ile)-lysidine synthase